MVGKVREDFVWINSGFGGDDRTDFVLSIQCRSPKQGRVRCDDDDGLATYHTQEIQEWLGKMFDGNNNNGMKLASDSVCYNGTFFYTTPSRVCYVGRSVCIGGEDVCMYGLQKLLFPRI